MGKNKFIICFRDLCTELDIKEYFPSLYFDKNIQNIHTIPLNTRN